MPQSEDLSDINQLRVALLSDFMLFTRVMFEKRTGREFMMSQPIGNESHFLAMSRAFERAFRLDATRILLNCPPGWSKSELCKSYIAWAMAHYPDSKFMYISYSHELAAMHTHSIKQTMMMPIYRQLFGVEIRRDSSAKDYFQNTHGGAVVAFGSQGGITGHDAGLPGLDRCSGGIVIDDIHKPDEVHSDTIRERVKRNYFETIERRPRAPNVPIFIAGQRLHEDDLMAHLLSGADGNDWDKIIIKGIDDAGNARYPEVSPLSQLMLLKEKQPYVFASQYQQDPMPAGGGIFKEEWFPLLDEMPDIISTFVTVDSAETDREYNDATVFSFWGLHRIKFREEDTGKYGLVWLDCAELRIEPKDLEDEFLDFYAGCMRFKVKPRFAAIEKKSTGVTLLSTLKGVPGLKTIDIQRSRKSGTKTDRFLEMQAYIAEPQVAFMKDARHTRMCIEHMRKITANNTHRFDDIADTCYDAVKMALIDKVIVSRDVSPVDHSSIARNMMSGYRQLDTLRKASHGRSGTAPPGSAYANQGKYSPFV